AATDLQNTHRCSRTTGRTLRSVLGEAAHKETGQRPVTPARCQLREGGPPTQSARTPDFTGCGLLTHPASHGLRGRIDLIADDRVRDVEASDVAVEIFYFQSICRAGPAAACQSKGCGIDARYLDVAKQPFTARVHRRRKSDDPSRNRSEWIVGKESSVDLVINRMRDKRNQHCFQS